MREIADSVGAYLFVDMAHIAGLVAGGVHPSPVPHRGFRHHHHAQEPARPARRHHHVQGGVCEGHRRARSSPASRAARSCTSSRPRRSASTRRSSPRSRTTPQQVVSNAKALAARLAKHGYRIVSGGTDNHLMLVDLRPDGLNGKIASESPRPRRHHGEQERHPVRHRADHAKAAASASARPP